MDVNKYQLRPLPQIAGIESSSYHVFVTETYYLVAGIDLYDDWRNETVSVALFQAYSNYIAVGEFAAGRLMDLRKVERSLPSIFVLESRSHIFQLFL